MTDLTDRMRTCAAHMLSCDDQFSWVHSDFEEALRDAVNLLVEASNELEQLHSTGALRIPADLGEPMQIIEPVAESWGNKVEPGEWIDPDSAMPLRVIKHDSPRNPRACPHCDSRAQKKVIRQGRTLMLVCPVCSMQWEWKAR